MTRHHAGVVYTPLPAPRAPTPLGIPRPAVGALKPEGFALPLAMPEGLNEEELVDDAVVLEGTRLPGGGIGVRPLTTGTNRYTKLLVQSCG